MCRKTHSLSPCMDVSQCRYYARTRAAKSSITSHQQTLRSNTCESAQQAGTKQLQKEMRRAMTIQTSNQNNLHVAQMEYEYRLERSEEHTSELQSRGHLVCRLLL